MELVGQDASPYLNEFDFNHSPSPSSAQHNISPHSYDGFDFTNQNQSPHFPHTPSYNGSFQNSPYSGHSDLSFGPGEPTDFSLFDAPPPGVQIREDYDPSEYDPPNSTGLLMFGGEFMSDLNNQSGHVSVSVTPADLDQISPHSFDYSSPSSNGGGESGGDPERRSRASSVASNPHPSSSSPRLDVTQNFENMRFESPRWGAHPLPHDRAMSPPEKPNSPPQLLIPDSSSPSANDMFPQSPPTINAPAGDGGVIGSGPQLHIVPATPVSGGGGASQTVPFQQTLEELRQNSAQNNQQNSWNHLPESHEDTASLPVSQYSQHAQLPYSFPGRHSHDAGSAGLSGGSTHSNTQSVNDNNYLYAAPPRSRSKSDTSLQPPLWNTDFMSQDQMPTSNGSALDDAGTCNMNDVLASPGSHPSSANSQHATFGSNTTSQLPHLGQHYTFGPSSPNYNSNDFLSPDFGTSLRRAKSDGSSRIGHRQSRSEDMRHSSTHLFPPSSQQDFISRQYLHPQESIPAIRSHARRASYGSRTERIPGGSWSNSSSTRPSPYPSPSASPRYRADELPNVALSGRQAPMLSAADIEGYTIPPSPDPSQGSGYVSKPNVTTGRTAEASHRRRKQEANFQCPIPGCKSTFTRSFNLKGHLRSHNEEKPFQCKWPGCGKGFARQHDCKRHEQLHSNFRPFLCDGCQKTFARMDALNRHLRSEGGAECAKLLAESGANPRNPNNLPTPEEPPARPPSIPVTKTEGDLDGFPGMTVML